MVLARTLLVLTTLVVSALAADPALLRLVPADAKLVGGMDVNNSIASPLGQFLLAQMQGDEKHLSELISATGFDPRRDLREVLVASNEQGRAGHGLVLARGTFDVQRILGHVRSREEAAVTKYAGVDVITGKRPEGGWFAFLDGNTVMAGPAAVVKAALDTRGSASTLDPAIVGKVNDVSARYDAWVVSRIPITSRVAPHMPDRQTQGMMKSPMFEAIEEASGGVKFGQTVQFGAEAVTRSEKDATALADVVRFLTSMLQMNADRPEAAQLLALLGTLDVKALGNTVKLSLSVPEAEIEKLILEKKRPVRQAKKAD